MTSGKIIQYHTSVPELIHRYYDYTELRIVYSDELRIVHDTDEI